MMKLERLVLLSLVVSLASGCASQGARYASTPMADAPPTAAPAPLERSEFARDPQGQLSEEKIQTILAARLELALPSRVGVLPIVDATDWRGPGPSYEMAPGAVANLVEELRGGEPFSLVTEMMPIPSGALGMEALREMAARYQLRYVLLYREKIQQNRRSNAWVAGYVTLLGALFLPGDTLTVDGYVEASLFDVKTGILLFTVRRRITGERATNVWHTDLKLATMQRRAAVQAAPELAKDVRVASYRFAEAAAQENERRLATQSVPPADLRKPTSGNPGPADVALTD
jgi:hypothetical protein